MAWNRPSEDAAGHRVNVDATSPSRHWWYVVGAVAVLGAAVAAWWLWPTGDSEGETAAPQAKQRIKEVSPAQRGAAPRPRDEKPAADAQPPANGQTPQFVPPAPPVRTNEASRLRAMNSVHRTGFEQILLNIFSCEPGNMPRPLPSDIPEAEMKRLAEILISKDEIKDSDTENMRLAKDLLAKAKAAMVKFIKDGGEPEEFIVSYHEQLEHAFHERQKAVAFVGQLVREGEDPAVISKYVDKTNEKFAAQGIMEIDKPAVAEEQGDE